MSSSPTITPARLIAPTRLAPVIQSTVIATLSSAPLDCQTERQRQCKCPQSHTAERHHQRFALQTTAKALACASGRSPYADIRCSTQSGPSGWELILGPTVSAAAVPTTGSCGAAGCLSSYATTLFTELVYTGSVNSSVATDAQEALATNLILPQLTSYFPPGNPFASCTTVSILTSVPNAQATAGQSLQERDDGAAVQVLKKRAASATYSQSIIWPGADSLTTGSVTYTAQPQEMNAPVTPATSTALLASTPSASPISAAPNSQDMTSSLVSLVSSILNSQVSSSLSQAISASLSSQELSPPTAASSPVTILPESSSVAPISSPAQSSQEAFSVAVASSTTTNLAGSTAGGSPASGTSNSQGPSSSGSPASGAVTSQESSEQASTAPANSISSTSFLPIIGESTVNELPNTTPSSGAMTITQIIYQTVESAVNTMASGPGTYVCNSASCTMAPASPGSGSSSSASATAPGQTANRAEKNERSLMLGGVLSLLILFIMVL